MLNAELVLAYCTGACAERSESDSRTVSVCTSKESVSRVGYPREGDYRMGCKELRARRNRNESGEQAEVIRLKGNHRGPSRKSVSDKKNFLQRKITSKLLSEDN